MRLARWGGRGCDGHMVHALCSVCLWRCGNGGRKQMFSCGPGAQFWLEARLQGVGRVGSEHWGGREERLDFFSPAPQSTAQEHCGMAVAGDVAVVPHCPL